MSAQVARQIEPAPGQSAARPTLLQRKCACGTHTPGGESCRSCEHKAQRGLQRKLSIGSSNDPLEHEADRVAAQVMEGPAPGAIARVRLALQRFTPGAAKQSDEAPASVDRALGRPGSALDRATRDDMEGRFGHDFSRVRVHNDGPAAEAARDVGAHAFTVGSHIVFGAGEYAPRSTTGLRLLAHEMTHVVQQSADSRTIFLQRAPGRKGGDKKSKAGGAKPKVGGGKTSKPKPPPTICSRLSLKQPGNWITKVNVDLSSNSLTIDWEKTSPIPEWSPGAHPISPGAGLCCLNCDDEKTSRLKDTLCTPKGTFKVDNTRCHLSGKHSSVKDITDFQRPGIAIHKGITKNPPLSHGCSRTDGRIAAVIHDNVIIGKTDISVTGTWSSSNCYKSEGAESPVKRADECDGFKRRTKPADPKKAGAVNQPGGPNPPAADQPAVVETSPEPARDGPGPDNEGGGAVDPSMASDAPVVDDGGEGSRGETRSSPAETEETE